MERKSKESVTRSWQFWDDLESYIRLEKEEPAVANIYTYKYMSHNLEYICM